MPTLNPLLESDSIECINKDKVLLKSSNELCFHFADKLRTKLWRNTITQYHFKKREFNTIDRVAIDQKEHPYTLGVIDMRDFYPSNGGN